MDHPNKPARESFFVQVKVYAVEIAATLVFLTFVAVETWGMLRHLVGR
jgi:hypothetical protein